MNHANSNNLLYIICLKNKVNKESPREVFIYQTCVFNCVQASAVINPKLAEGFLIDDR